MESAPSPSRRHAHPVLAAPLPHADNPLVSALLEENAQLRNLVVELSRLVVRNVLRQK